MNYDFSQLNDKEFEEFVVDLLSANLKTRFERFKAGRDQGVDGRFFKDSGGESIIQCKHWVKSGTTALIRKLENSEVKKVIALKPDEYILVTSCELSRSDKQKIYKLFSPYIKNESFIYGREDLNDILKNHNEIEKIHYKLWFNSTTVLENIIHNDVIGRSGALLMHAREKNKMFVRTACFKDALERLEENGVVILTGEPGVGKTSIAENLYLHYASIGFSVYDVIRDINEAEKVFQSGERQMFLFDDFLGSNYLDAVLGREDSHVVKFIRRVATDSKKRFILTTRTNILNQGKQVSDILRNAKLEQKEYLLTVKDISNLEKAKILYNHIWHSDLCEEYIEKIYLEERYMVIIKHRNFNPRVIEFVTSCSRRGFPSAAKYWDFIEESLSNPTEVWHNCFSRQNDVFVKWLVKIVVFAGGQIAERDLSSTFSRVVYNGESVGRLVSFPVFSSVVELAVQSFLNRNINTDGSIEYSLFNPSISDYVIRETIRNREEMVAIFDSLDTLSSLSTLSSLRSNNLISWDNYSYILLTVCESMKTENKGLDYQIKLGYLCVRAGVSSKVLRRVVDELRKIPRSVERKVLLLDSLVENLDLIDDSGLNFLINCFGCDDLDYETLLSFSHLVEIYSYEADVNLRLKEFLIAGISNLVNQSAEDWFRDLNPEDYVSVGNYEHEDFDVDEDKIIEEMERRLSGMLSDFPIFSAELGVLEFDDVLRSAIDIHELLDSYKSMRSESGGYSGGIHSSDKSDAEIHDLFQRS